MKLLLFHLIITLFLIGCSSKSDEEYLKEAENNIKENNISEAVTSYENLINEYPESKFAPEALYQLAALYQNKMIKNISDYESLDKAANNYKEVYEKYPDSERAAESLFMSAFIQANELKKFKEATDSYKLFIEKYPDHPLVSSAKEELDHMGLSPDEILKKKDKISI